MTTMLRPPLLRLESVIKRFGAVEAVVDFDLELHTHEVVALVGDNAAGKSTVARMIAGEYQPDAGRLLLDGQPLALTSAADAFRHGIATVFQNLALAENLDVTANIFLGREVKEGGRLLAEQYMERKAREYLDRLNAKITSPRTPLSELSAGQRQCVAIARTLVGEPRIIVLDEPTSSLSVTQTAEVLSYVQALRDLGLGVLIISHSLNDVLAVSDRIEVIRHGRNNGSFETASTRYEQVLSAITGATRYDRSARP